jgi:hypothetical protein
MKKFNDLSLYKNSPILTGILDVDKEIFLKLDDKELFTICITPTNRYIRKICDENFFMNRSIKSFPEISKNKDINLSWKKFYVFVRLLELFGNSNQIQRFLQYKNKPSFIRGNKLEKFLQELNTTGIRKEIYEIIAPLLSYRLTSMITILRIIIIIKSLNLGETPDDFMNYIATNENLDNDHLQYVNNDQIKAMTKNMEENIEIIYNKIIGNIYQLF